MKSTPHCEFSASHNRIIQAVSKREHIAELVQSFARLHASYAGHTAKTFKCFRPAGQQADICNCSPSDCKCGQSLATAASGETLHISVGRGICGLPRIADKSGCRGIKNELLDRLRPSRFIKILRACHLGGEDSGKRFFRQICDQGIIQRDCSMIYARNWAVHAAYALDQGRNVLLVANVDLLDGECDPSSSNFLDFSQSFGVYGAGTRGDDDALRSTIGQPQSGREAKATCAANYKMAAFSGYELLSIGSKARGRVRRCHHNLAYVAS